MELYININRFHPLLVHLPIGMLFMALLLELLQWWSKRRDLEDAVTIILNVSLVAALFSVGTGWFLAEEGGYDVETLFWHRWLAIGMTAVLAFICLLRTGGVKQLTLPLLCVSILLLSIAGHFGGSLTHGSDYLFTSGVEDEIVVADIQEAAVFETIIQPILKQKCMSCHNPEKAKGALLMTTIEGLKAGGEKGKLIDFDAPMKSALLARIHLPKGEKEHMPPKGKKQLTTDEILLLEWWLKNKACFDCKVKETEEQEKVAAILEKYATPAASKLKSLPALTKAQLATLKTKGIPVKQLSADNPYLIVNLAGKKNLDKNTFRALRDVGDYMLELNLQDSNFSDELASWLSSFPQLQKLQLQNTTISNKSITDLESLGKLQSLNLYGTAITDEAIPVLESLTSLQRLYCWGTQLTKNGVQKLQEEKPQLEIQYQIAEDLFGGAVLNAPLVTASTYLFKDTVHIRLGGAFKGASIFYTIDGSDPDSTSLLYQDSIVLAETATLKTYCYKKGWTSSVVKEIYFRKAGFTFKSVALASPPDDAYKGKGGATLMDQVQGTADLKDGNWLGYQGQNISLVAELDTTREVKTVSLSSMSSPGPWLFFPKGINVSTSIDGKKFRSAAKEQYDIAQEGFFRKRKYFELDFEPRSVRFIKMVITSQGKNPKWHTNAGEDCWLFVDEIAAE